MIRVRQIKVDIAADISEIKNKCAKRLKIDVSDIKSITIHKQSLDARKKPILFYVYEVDVTVNDEKTILRNNNCPDVMETPDETYHFPITGNKEMKNHPVIVGSGPAGLFCAYMLSLNGYQPVVIERGECIEKRIKTVEKFWTDGQLNNESNVQFGEGGAGTFSDGKLNSMVKDPCFRVKKMLEIFVEAGAPNEILYMHNPHIGTDLLRKIVINIRKKTIECGGKFRYNTCLTDIKVDNDKIVKIQLNNNEWIDCENLILAIGHSAHDTFKMLYNQKLKMEAKPFAVGVRVQHSQKLIDYNQYGMVNSRLPHASYKLTYKASNGRGVYSFCMCPGGYVVDSSSDSDQLVINGMSNYKRDTENANSAIIVTVTPDDFGYHALDGLNYQKELEKRAYKIGHGQIPVQVFKDFKENKISTSFNSINPVFKGKYQFANLNQIFPTYISESLKEGIDYFGQKIKGFNSDDTVLAAVESRTSSPVRILRDNTYQSNIKGIYPCGEGAGYAGGITSSVIDGIKIAEQIASIYSNRK